ncbi:tyrosine-type recombinase/integrase [Pseudomonas fluorescens]|uniref:tyrosine-type recombinase/integrase n=1 Tax=Pseudomonas fluorescens TaxID=294 RepID=UPI0017875567|nr:integrase family protein [Pseudomonas fluorescens]
MKRAPSLKLNFTKAALDSLPLPESGQRSTYHDTQVNGLQIRVTANGTKTFYVFQRVNGKPERVKVGEHPYPIMGIDQARKRAKEIIHQIAEGQSPNVSKREEKAKSLTLAEAVERYVEKKLRADDLPLKPRTIADYRAMLKPSRLTAAGKPTKGGALARLADKSIHGLTAAEIRTVHDENLKLYGERQACYAAQTLKAILRYHAIDIPHSPFAKSTPEVDRIRIKKAGVAPREPIKKLSMHLGIWWRALHALPPSPVTDYIAFLALTGCRPGEPLKVLVGDLVNGEIRLRDTKNRSDHTLLLSTQALAIAQRNVEGKAPTDHLFRVTPAQANALAHELSAATGITFVPKMTRSLFASTAEKIVTFGVLKGLMNHKQKNDLLNTNYIEKTEAELREGWQVIANYIEGIATSSVIPISRKHN